VNQQEKADAFILVFDAERQLNLARRFNAGLVRVNDDVVA
jgi:hypothetical protein